jgi:carboxypeptidase PM20D1
MAVREGTAEPARAVAKLQALVRIPTVSHADPGQVDTAAFDAFLAELERQFPLVHERLELTRIHTHALLLRWPGTDHTRPVVLMAHLDVVPVEGPWRHDPFAAEIADGAVWGRGTARRAAARRQKARPWPR